MKGNGIAALRCWPVRVELGGVVYRIAPHPAVTWIVPLVDNDWFAIVPALLDPADVTVDEALDNGTVTHVDCLQAARDAVSVTAGVPWWVALRLIQTMAETPELAGELALQGVDAAVVSLGAVVQALYRVVVREADRKQRRKIDSDLERVPAEVSIEERIAQATVSSGFEEMARARGLSF